MTQEVIPFVRSWVSRAFFRLAASAAEKAQGISEEAERIKKKLKAQVAHTEDLESVSEKKLR